MTWLIASTIKMSVVLGVGLIAASASRFSSAALRHWIIAASLLCAALVPVIGLIGPAWTIPVAQPIAAGPMAVDVAVERAPAVRRIPEHEAATPAPRAWRLDSAASWIVPVWIGGGLVNLLALALSMGRLRRAARDFRAVASGAWLDELARAVHVLGVRRRVRLVQSNQPALLVTWGFMAPQVVLPRGADGWSADRARVVLTHELAHIARGDWLLQIGAELLRCLYWFNPVLWLACLRLRQESERACDDAVLAAGVGGAAYATELLELARLFGSRRRSSLPAPALTGRSSMLERRIRAMFDTRLRRAPLSRGARWGLLAAFAALTLPIAIVAQTSFGSVSGVVTDPMSRVLPGVTITIADAQKTATHEVSTDRDGRFQLVGLVPGTYTMQAALPGFEPQSSTFVVNGNSVEQNVALEIGSIQETITVTAAPPPPPAPTISRAGQPRATPPCPAASPIGGNLRAPWKIRDARPAYAGIDGVVALTAVVAADGSVTDVRVVRSDRPELDGPAVDAVSHWQFDSTLLNCVPVAVNMNVSMMFKRQ